MKKTSEETKTITSQQKIDLINEYNGVISRNKWYLADTDYQSLREFEGGEPMDKEVKAKREEARAVINEYQQKLVDLELIPVEDPKAPEMEL